MRIARKVRLLFDDQTFTFDTTYDPDLKQIMSNEEFDEVLSRINLELALELQENAQAVRHWYKVFSYGLIVLFGFVFLPVVLVKAHRQSKLLVKFYENIKSYFLTLNKKTFSTRSVEWKIIKEKVEKTDEVDLDAQLVIEIVYENDETKEQTKRVSHLITNPVVPSIKDNAIMMTPYDLKLTQLEEEEEEEENKLIPRKKHHKHRHHHRKSKIKTQAESTEKLNVSIAKPEKRKNIPLYLQELSDEDE